MAIRSNGHDGTKLLFPLLQTLYSVSNLYKLLTESFLHIIALYLSCQQQSTISISHIFLSLISKCVLSGGRGVGAGWIEKRADGGFS